MAATHPPPVQAFWTAADVHRHLGYIPLQRIRVVPGPGEATVDDVLKSKSHGRPICELIDGVLVEKTMGYLEACLAMELGFLLRLFLEKHNLGVVAGADGALRILPEQVRIPDVSFITWQRLPDRKLPKEPVPALAPDLAVEILSEGNTEAEMQRKLRDYFTAGVRLVWYIDARTRTATAYTAVDQPSEIDADGCLSGGEVLPGFEVALKELFARAERSDKA